MLRPTLLPNYPRLTQSNHPNSIPNYITPTKTPTTNNRLNEKLHNYPALVWALSAPIHNLSAPGTITGTWYAGIWYVRLDKQRSIAGSGTELGAGLHVAGIAAEVVYRQWGSQPPNSDIPARKSRAIFRVGVVAMAEAVDGGEVGGVVREDDKDNEEHGVYVPLLGK